MWTPTTRRQHSRTGLRYASDLTDAEWALLELLLPPPCDQGRPRSWPMREVVNAIFYVMRSGSCARAARGGFCPATSRPGARYTAGLRRGVTKGSVGSVALSGAA